MYGHGSRKSQVKVRRHRIRGILANVLNVTNVSEVSRCHAVRRTSYLLHDQTASLKSGSTVAPPAHPAGSGIGPVLAAVFVAEIGDCPTGRVAHGQNSTQGQRKLMRDKHPENVPMDAALI